MPRQTSVAVIGGGPVGSLLACFLGKHGFQVSLFEARDDIRLQETVPGRSINLAVSERGRAALRAVGMEQAVVGSHALPMRGRLIHDPDGSTRSLLYDTRGQAIYSTGRRFLNEALLTAAEQYPNVKLHFGQKLVWCDVETAEVRFQGSEEVLKFDLVVGCDGAHSTVRQHMLRRPMVDFRLESIAHGYLELNIPPTPDGQFALAPDRLHIWARGTFLLIALPNQDASFTATLVLPHRWFLADLRAEDQLVAFFSRHFPDALALIGRDKLVQTFLSTKPSHFGSIKCSPYHVGSQVLILGDAAHAQVPFYGQGMNAGFEDCLILSEILQKNSFDIGKSLEEFSETRYQDATAICDLSMYNYTEMRDLVNSRMFLLRHDLDYFLHRLFPRLWVPLYIMVTFTRTRYRQCVERSRRQDKIVRIVLRVGALLAVLLAARRCRRPVTRLVLQSPAVLQVLLAGLDGWHWLRRTLHWDRHL